MTRRMHRVELFVKSSDHCVRLLKYVRHNLPRYVEADMLLIVKLVDPNMTGESLISNLRGMGVTALPAMVCSGKVTVGTGNIQSTLEALTGKRPPVEQQPVDEDDEVERYMARELYSNVSREGDKFKIREEDESMGEDGKSMDERLREYKKREPSHRRTILRPPEEEMEHAAPPTPRMMPSMPKKTTHTPTAPSLSAESALDECMIQAWMENNPIEDREDDSF